MSCKIIPINPQSNDPHERYMMNSVETKTESRGNGIKTVITNIDIIAKQIRLPVAHILQYFSYSLGVKSHIDVKNEKHILQGKFSNTEIQKIIYQLIEKWILCSKCKAPETEITIKNDTISFNCRGCGTVTCADPKEKIYNYMISHPPPKNKLSEKEKSVAKIRMDDIESQFSIVAALDTKEWSVDISEEAINERQKKLSLEFIVENEKLSPVQILKEYLVENEIVSKDQIEQKVLKIKEEYNLTEKDVTCLLCESLFVSNTFIKDLVTHAPLFNQFMKSKKYRLKLETIVLNYMEEIVGIQYPDLILKLEKILQTLYDLDYVSEESCIKWFNKEKSVFIKNKKTLENIKTTAKPFIDWLQNTKEE